MLKMSSSCCDAFLELWPFCFCGPSPVLCCRWTKTPERVCSSCAPRGTRCSPQRSCICWTSRSTLWTRPGPSSRSRPQSTPASTSTQSFLSRCVCADACGWVCRTDGSFLAAQNPGSDWSRSFRTGAAQWPLCRDCWNPKIPTAPDQRPLESWLDLLVCFGLFSVKRNKENCFLHKRADADLNLYSSVGGGGCLLCKTWVK